MNEQLFTRSQVEKVLQHEDSYISLTWGMYTDPERENDELSLNEWFNLLSTEFGIIMNETEWEEIWS